MTKITMSQQELDQHLFTACSDGDTDYAKLAIVAGANVDAISRSGNAPLHEVAFLGREEIAQTLIAAGADLDSKDSVGRTPKEVAELMGMHKVKTLLDIAAKRQGHAGRVEGSLHSDKVDFVKPKSNANIPEVSHAGRIAGERQDEGPPQVGG